MSTLATVLVRRTVPVLETCRSALGPSGPSPPRPPTCCPPVAALPVPDCLPLPAAQGPAPHWRCAIHPPRLGPPGNRTHGSASALGWGDAWGLRPGLQQGVGPGRCCHGLLLSWVPHPRLLSPPWKKNRAGVTDVFRLPMSVWAGFQGRGPRVPGTCQLACACTCLRAVGSMGSAALPAPCPACAVASPLTCSAVLQSEAAGFPNRVVPRMPVAAEPGKPVLCVRLSGLGL